MPIELNPNYAVAYSYRGNAYANKGEVENAMKDYNSAIKLDPYLAEVYYYALLSEQYYSNTTYAEAIAIEVLLTLK